MNMPALLPACWPMHLWRRLCDTCRYRTQVPFHRTDVDPHRLCDRCRDVPGAHGPALVEVATDSGLLELEHEGLWSYWEQVGRVPRPCVPMLHERGHGAV